MTQGERATATHIPNFAKIALVVGSTLPVAACWGDSDPTPAQTPASCYKDIDCDGITDAVDRSPSVADNPDADGDGILNGQDITPYGITSIPPYTPSPKTTVVPPPSAPTVTPYRPCIMGQKPDSDGDGFPDYCDISYDPNTKDSDNDGLPDSRDTHPYTYDWDNDGIPDGNDSDPNVNQRREEEKRQESRRQESSRQQSRISEHRYETSRSGY